VIDVATKTAVAPSRSAVRKMIESGAFYIGGNRRPSLSHIISSDDLIESKVLVLRAGKKEYHIIKVL